MQALPRSCQTGLRSAVCWSALFLADPESEYVAHLVAEDPRLESRIRSCAADAIEFDDESAHIEDLYYRLDLEKCVGDPDRAGLPLRRVPPGRRLRHARTRSLTGAGPGRMRPRHPRASPGGAEAGQAHLAAARPVQPGPPGHARAPPSAPWSGLRRRRGAGGAGRSADGASQA